MRLGLCLLLIPSAWCAGALVFDNPPRQDDQLNGMPLVKPGTPITVGFGATPYTVTFAAAAADVAAGVMQVNFVAPQQSTDNVAVSAGNRCAYFSVAVE